MHFSDILWAKHVPAIRGGHIPLDICAFTPHPLAQALSQQPVVHSLRERVHFAFLQRSQHQQQHGDGKHTRTNESGSSSNWGSKCFNSTNEVQRGVIRKCLKLAILIWTRDGGTGWEGGTVSGGESEIPGNPRKTRAISGAPGPQRMHGGTEDPCDSTCGHTY